MQTKEKRNKGIDILRVVSALLIVFLHVTSDYIYANPVGSTEFELALFMNTLTICAVPLFVVISGSLFLAGEKEYTVSKLWKSNILRLFILYIVWSFIYYVYQSVVLWDFPFWKQGIVRTVTGMVYASSHFWFLFMIMGLYALVPMLRTWLKGASKREEEYILFLFFVFQIVRFSVTKLLNKSLVDEISALVEIAELATYVGYFILGHYLSKYPPSKMFAGISLFIAVAGVFMNYLSSSYLSGVNGAYYTGISDSYGVFVFFQCIVLFHYVTKFFERKKLWEPLSKLISGVAKDTLGIYVMHLCVLGYMKHIKLLPDTLPTVVLILGYGILCYAICCIIAAILRRIPLVGKYLS